MIKAVIFDVGGVIVENPLPKMLKHYASEFGVEQAVFDVVFHEEFSAWQKGSISEDELWNRISKKLNCPKPTSSDLWLAGFKSEFAEHKKIIQFVEELKSKGQKLAILSDTETPVANFLQDRYRGFDVYVFSCERGYTKPQKEIFDLTLKELNIAPTEAIFIDDRATNIEGAEKVGIKSVLFDNEENVINTVNKIILQEK